MNEWLVTVVHKVSDARFQSNALSIKAQLPDVVLVKKIYPDKVKRNKGRNFRLKRLKKTSAADTATDDGNIKRFLNNLIHYISIIQYVINW